MCVLINFLNYFLLQYNSLELTLYFLFWMACLCFFSFFWLDVEITKPIIISIDSVDAIIGLIHNWAHLYCLMRGGESPWLH